MGRGARRSQPQGYSGSFSCHGAVVQRASDVVVESYFLRGGSVVVTPCQKCSCRGQIT